MFKTAFRGALLFALVLAFSGCAEINRRGGLVDHLEDKFLFRADTKSHRLLRSYVVLGALIAVGRNVGVPEADRAALGGSFIQALSYVDDAYKCIYPDRTSRSDDVTVTALLSADAPFTHCVFFDERMTRLDLAIYKMGVAILVDPESRKFLADVRDQLAGEIPVVGPALRAVTRANETIHEAATATQQVTTIVNNLLRFSFQSLSRAAYLLPIYRDAMELDMHVVLDTLWINCQPGWPAYVEKNKKRKKRFLDSDPSPEKLETSENGACLAYDYGSAIFNRGDGAIELWREFIVGLDGNVQMVNAHPAHFALVTRWLYKACVELFGPVDTKKKQNVCAAVTDKGVPTDPVVARNDPKGKPVRIEARQPAAPKVVAPPVPDPAPTGSVPPGSVSPVR